MNRQHIITLPNHHLRQRSKRINSISADVQRLVENMKSVTLDWEEHRKHELGVALAAVQIDELKRIVIVRSNFDDKNDKSFFVLINPEVIKKEGAITYDHEGCLSVSRLYGLVPRHDKIRVRAQGIDGREVRIRAEGFLARVLQHEIDHTNGIMFIDHIKNDDAFFTLTPRGELKKLPYEQVKDSDILW